MQWYIQSFFGQTGTYIKSTKAPPRLAQSGKFSSKFVPPDALKMHSLFVLQFSCKTVSKLLKFTLQHTLLCGWLLKKSIYLSNKNLYGYKLIRAVKQSDLKRWSNRPGWERHAIVFPRAHTHHIKFDL